MRQLNNQVTAERNVYFYAFSLVSAQDVDMHNSREFQMEWMKNQGFDVVEYKIVTAGNLDEAMDAFAAAIETNDFPSDGLVALYDDIAYGDSWALQPSFQETPLPLNGRMRSRNYPQEIEWSPSRMG